MPSKRGAVAENRHPPYEAKLTENGVSFRYAASVPLEDIQRYADSQARIRIAGSGTVSQYANQAKAGELFPPVVVWEDGRDGYVLLDGNTRKLAYEKLGRTHTDAYIVTGLEGIEHAIYVSSLFNSINGVPLAKDEILRAVKAGKSLAVPMADSALARNLGVPASKISRIMAAETFDRRAEKLSLATDLPEDLKVALSPVGDDSVFTDLLQLALDADLKGTEVRAIVKDVKGKGSEAERRQVVSDERTDLAPTIQNVARGRTSGAPPTKDVLMAFGRILSLRAKFPHIEDFVPLRLDARVEWYPKVQEIGVFIADLLQAMEAAGVEEAA